MEYSKIQDPDSDRVMLIPIPKLRKKPHRYSVLVQNGGFVTVCAEKGALASFRFVLELSTNVRNMRYS